MKLSVMLRTSDFRGDHAADVMVAHELESGETVEQLARRLFSVVDRYRMHEVLEIRIIQEVAHDAEAGR